MDLIRKSWRGLLLSALLGVMTLAAYRPLFRNDFLRYDDRKYVTDNPHVLTGLTFPNVAWAFQTGYAANWHPLTWLSHMLDIQIFGLKPHAHHLTSLLLHTLNSLLVFYWLKRLIGATRRSFFVAALFALHPLHVESVAWLAERKDVLSTLFFLLTLLAYTEYARTLQPSPSANRPRSPVWYALALVCFALGLMSKPMLVTLPFVLLLLDFWPLWRFQSSVPNPRASAFRRLFLEKLPFLALAILSCVITLSVQEKGHAVSTGCSWSARIANALLACSQYLRKTFWPSDLAIFYPHPATLHPDLVHWLGWRFYAVLLLFATLTLSAWWSWKRRPWVTVGWFWFVGTLAPVLGLVQVGGQGLADRYTYIPLLGIFIALVWCLAEFAASNLPRTRLLTATGALALLLCAAATHRQVTYWRTNSFVFIHALAVTRHNAVAHCELGTDLSNDGELLLAIEQFKAATAADPSCAEAWYNLGIIFWDQGKFDDAIKAYQSGLSAKPWQSWARNSLGEMLWSRGRQDEALKEYNEALRYNPELFDAHFNLGSALLARGQITGAKQQFSAALRLKPDSTQTRAALDQILATEPKTNAQPPHL